MEIIAALIIACSNLYSGYDNKIKKACIQRVSDCAEKKRVSSAVYLKDQLACSKEVY